MARLAENHVLTLADGSTVSLRPTLRAALRLAREYQSFAPILRGIAEGSTLVLSRVVGECMIPTQALADLFIVPGRSLSSRIMELQPIALDLVYGLLGIDPDKPSEASSSSSAKLVDFVEQCENLFGLATGILRWAPEDAWNATPMEIMAAATYRANSYGAKSNEKQELTLDEQAMLLAARLDARAS